MMLHPTPHLMPHRQTTTHQMMQNTTRGQTACSRPGSHSMVLNQTMTSSPKATSHPNPYLLAARNLTVNASLLPYGWHGWIATNSQSPSNPHMRLSLFVGSSFWSLGSSSTGSSSAAGGSPAVGFCDGSTRMAIQPSCFLICITTPFLIPISMDKVCGMVTDTDFPVFPTVLLQSV